MSGINYSENNMSEILSPCESCVTIRNECLFNTNAVEHLLIERMRSINDYQIRIVEASTGEGMSVFLQDVWRYINDRVGIKKEDVCIKHLMVYIYYGLEEIKSKRSGISLNQMALVHMGKAYRFNDMTRLEDIDIKKHCTLQLMYKTYIPKIRITIEAALATPKESVTYFESILKKLKSDLLSKRKARKKCDMTQGIAAHAGVQQLLL